MKKIKFGILLSLMICVGILGWNLRKNTYVFADSTTYSIAEEMVITGDESYTGDTFNVSLSTNAFNISSGATLTLKNCTIDGINNATITSLFTVSTGGKLVLDNVTIQNFASYTYGIKNSGNIEITNTNFLNKSGTYAVEHSSTEEGSFLYRSGELHRVALKKGAFISVDKYSNITSTTQVKLDTNYLTISRVIVKGIGENVFPSKFMDKFILVGEHEYVDDNDDTYLFEFDYLGDFDKTTNPQTCTINTSLSLNWGDIVLTARTLYYQYKDGGTQIVYYSAPNCTGYKFLKEQDKTYIEENGLRFARTDGSLAIDNYSATPIPTGNAPSFNMISDGVTTLTVKSIIDGEAEEYSAYVDEFLTGTNRAVFVDIPENSTLKSVKMYNGDSEVTNVFSVSTDTADLYSNGTYMRPILEYIGSTDYFPSYTNFSVEFIFEQAELEPEPEPEPEPVYVNVTINSNNNLVSVQYTENMEVGSEQTFTIPFVQNLKITEVKFNGSLVSLISTQNAYTFSAEVIENNVIDIVAISLPINIEITPAPADTEFAYGETIVLTQTVPVAETGDVITITYNPNAETNAKTYNLDLTNYSWDNRDKDKWSKEDYNITFVNGTYTYEIVPQIVDLSIIQTQRVNKVYSEDMTLSADMFITYIPSYLSAEFDYNNYEPQIGLRNITINVSLNSQNYQIKDNATSIQAELNLTPAEISVASYFTNFVDFSCDYSNSSILHEFALNDNDKEILDVNFVYKDHENNIVRDLKNGVNAQIKNAGNYTVTAIFTCNELYEITGVGTKTVSLEIKKLNIDTEDYELALIEANTYVYDGTDYTFDKLEDSLPAGVTGVIVSPATLTQKNAGTYNVTLTLNFDAVNYNCKSTINTALVISPKLIGITLTETSFDYAPNTAPRLTAVASNGVIEGDVVNVTLDSSVNRNAGTHEIAVASIDNTNYRFDSLEKLTYVINKIVYPLIDVEFNGYIGEYDGEDHTPELEGELPEWLYYSITNIVCKDAGRYEMTCTFSGENNNYLVPANLTAIVEISKKSLTAEFTNPDNMIANGIRKDITVRLVGFVKDETIAPIVTYSANPVNAGKYICYVNIPANPNYILTGKVAYEFSILSDDVRYHDDKVSFLLEGMFDGDGNVKVVHNNNNAIIANLLIDEDIKTFKCMSLSYSSYSQDPVKISVPVKDVVGNSKYLKVFKLINGELVELDYTIENNLVTFNLNSGGDIVFVEEQSMLYKNRFAIMIVSILAVLSVITSVAFVLTHHKKKNKLVNIVKQD